ncbi:MAG: tRNA lysidine(34) synthetase TilS [Treponema sp.]|nr:tRNA lysidine(34) synthetase TilS [Treponema sp.]
MGDCVSSSLLLAAVSGGADSIAMLSALLSLKEGGAGFSLRVIHVEHGIRSEAESRGDALFVQEFCRLRRIPCRTIHIRHGKIAEKAGEGGIEAAARSFRQRIFAAECRRTGASRLCIAHTADDLLETLLMRLLSGSGPAGLASMPRSSGKILRPLIALSRGDVLAYLEERGISYRKDKSNDDIRFFRNRVRNRLIPLLDIEFPHWRAALSALGETQRLSVDFLRAEASRLAWESEPGKGLRCHAAAFFRTPEIVREEALFLGIDALAGKRENFRPKRKILRAFSRGLVNGADLGALRVCREGDFVRIKPGRRGEREKGFALLIKSPGKYKLTNTVPVLNITVLDDNVPEKAGEQVLRAALPLLVRPCLKTDTVSPGRGREKSLRDFLRSTVREGDLALVDREGLAAVLRLCNEGAGRVYGILYRRNAAAENSGEKRVVCLETSV